MRESIAFDFDGVIADTNKAKIKWFLDRNIKIGSTDKTNIYKTLKTNNYTEEEIDKLYRNMAKSVFTKKVLEGIQPIHGAIQAIKRLSENYDIYIITARTDQMINEQVNVWLQKYMLNNCIKKVISSSFEDKQSICIKNNINFLCDDDYRHISDNKVNIRALYNSRKNNISDKKIIIVKSWDEIVAILL